MFESMEKLLESLNENGSIKMGGKWLPSIKQALEKLQESYGKLREIGRDPIDYSRPETQAAYVFAFAVGRCAFTSELLSMHAENLSKPLFGKSVLTVTSLGGGPGSELAGLLDYLSDPASGESVTEVRYRVLDRNLNWQPVVDDLVSRQNPKVKINLEFVCCDMASEIDMAKVDLQGCDLIICSYLISELFAHPQATAISSNLRGLFSKADVGTATLYIDSDAYSFYTFFNQSWKSVKGLRQVSEIQDDIDCGDREFGATYLEFAGILQTEPRLDGKIVSKYLVRESV